MADFSPAAWAARRRAASASVVEVVEAPGPRRARRPARPARSGRSRRPRRRRAGPSRPPRAARRRRSRCRPGRPRCPAARSSRRLTSAAPELGPAGQVDGGRRVRLQVEDGRAPAADGRADRGVEMGGAGRCGGAASVIISSNRALPRSSRRTPWQWWSTSGASSASRTWSGRPRGRAWHLLPRSVRADTDPLEPRGHVSARRGVLPALYLRGRRSRQSAARSR